MKKSLSKEFMLEEGFAEMEAEKASISVENWYLEDCVTTVLNEIEDWKRNNWFFMEPEIGPWFYELETYDQTLLLVEAVNCLAKSENPAWYGAKDMIVNVLLNGKTSTDLPPDAIVWMEESWACQLSRCIREWWVPYRYTYQVGLPTT